MDKATELKFRHKAGKAWAKFLQGEMNRLGITMAKLSQSSGVGMSTISYQLSDNRSPHWWSEKMIRDALKKIESGT